MRRILTALLTAACLLLGLAGCGAAPLRGAVAAHAHAGRHGHAGAGAGPVCTGLLPQSSFHPITGGNRTNLSLGGLLYEGLFALDPQFQVQNVLCESYTVSRTREVDLVRVPACAFPTAAH